MALAILIAGNGGLASTQAQQPESNARMPCDTTLDVAARGHPVRVDFRARSGVRLPLECIPAWKSPSFSQVRSSIGSKVSLRSRDRRASPVIPAGVSTAKNVGTGNAAELRPTL